MAPEARELGYIGWRSVAEGAEQRLGQRPVRHGRLAGNGTSREHPHACTLSAVGQFSTEPRLAHPGVADEADHAAGTAGGVLQAREKHIELTGAPDENRAKHRLHGP
jgi:hypothetical protein